MKIARLTFNPFQENTYVLWDETGEAVVVDAGNYTPKETEALRGFIEEKGLRPVLAVNTHGHVDHIGQAAELANAHGVPLWMHEADDFMLTEPAKGLSWDSSSSRE